MKWIKAIDVPKENYRDYKYWRVVCDPGGSHSIDSSDYWFADSQTIYFKHGAPRIKTNIEFLVEDDCEKQDQGGDMIF